MNAQVSESRFNMWRAVIALAHADHIVTPEEREFIQQKLDKIDFSPEQANQLREDLQTAQPVSEILPHITEPQDRSMLIYYGRLLVWSDGEYDAQEERLLRMLKNDVTSKVDMDKAMLEAKSYAERYANDYERSLSDEEDRQNRKMMAPFRWFYDVIGRV